MATQKPLSTISYNSESFLKEKLEDWISNHIIQSYMYIKHKGEDGDKDHIHLRIEPNKRIDPMDLQEKLREYDAHHIKPLGCRPFRPSKEEDWILYAVHDKEYLKLKYKGGEKGEKIPYQWQDIVADEYYDTEIAFIRAKAYLEHTSVNMATQIQNGTSPMSLILQGENVHTVNAIMRALSVTDYERITTENIYLKNQNEQLVNAINKLGLSIVVNENNELSII